MEKKLDDKSFVFFTGVVSIAPELVQKTPTGDLTKFNIAIEQGTPKKASYKVEAWNALARPCTDFLNVGNRICLAGFQKMKTYSIKDKEGKEIGIGKSAEIKLLYIKFSDVGSWTEEFDKYIAWRAERRSQTA